jgi:hypothetical protein
VNQCGSVTRDILSHLQSKTSERLKSYTRHLVAPSVRCMTEGGMGAKLRPQLCASYRHPHELQKARALNGLGRGLNAAAAVRGRYEESRSP